MKQRRAIGTLAVVGLTAWLVLGLVPAASAAVVTGTTGSFTTSADDTDVAAGAQITGYTGGGGAVIIPNTVMIGSNTYNVTSIGDNAFTFKGLTSISIPPTVTSIGMFGLAENAALDTITLPAGLTSIGYAAFATGGLSSITIPNGVTDIPAFAFNDDNLSSVTLGNGVTTIGANAFSENHLTSIDLPSTVTSIGDEAFQQNAGLTELLLPASITSIGQNILDNTATHVGFLGAPPATFTAAGATGSLGTGASLVVSYIWGNGVPQLAGGFTNPTWMGYNTSIVDRITFDANGHGTAPAFQIVAPGRNATQPADPTATGYAFTGWFTSPALTTKYDFADPVTTDVTIYAGWASLATTGVAINPFVIPGAIAVLMLGALLMVVARLRRRRASE